MFELKYLKNVTTLKLDIAKCTGCKMCSIVCPHDVFVIESKKAFIENKDACMECGACAMNCPEEALSVKPGVGCAAGVLQGWLKGTEPTCDCTSTESSCC
ncbi:MAG: ferredoxin [candidate division Zixibacteria bacterium]|nr:ferredoxin [candidate division Zixibacteria bacterium]